MRGKTERYQTAGAGMLFFPAFPLLICQINIKNRIFFLANCFKQQEQKKVKVPLEQSDILYMHRGSLPGLPMYPLKSSHCLADWSIALERLWSGKNILAPQKQAKNTALGPEAGICCWKNNISINMSCRFIHLACWHARGQQNGVPQNPRLYFISFLSVCHNQPWIWRAQNPASELWSVSRWNIWFFFFFFAPQHTLPFSPKLIILEGEMRLIFQGRVHWTVVMWLIPLSETLPKS